MNRKTGLPMKVFSFMRQLRSFLYKGKASDKAANVIDGNVGESVAVQTPSFAYRHLSLITI